MKTNRTNRARAAVLATALTILLIPAGAQASSADIATSIRNAGLHVHDLKVIQIEGIVILRGKVNDTASYQRLGQTVRNLGHARVANLVHVEPLPDDKAIERATERALSLSRTLEGCNFTTVKSEDGVVTLHGTVRYELQKDAAAQIARE